MARDTLQFGIRPPNWVSQDETYQEITDWVVRSEEIGFDSVHVGEQIIAKVPPYTSTVYDQQISLASWAERTDEIELGSLITVVPYYHPVHLAKTFGTLDVASEGRIILGAGNGYRQPEFEVFGVPMNQRGRRTEETVEIMKRLWTEDHVDYTGEIFQLENVSIEPKSTRDPHPPVWFGATLEEFTSGVIRLHERIGRLGDGWVPMPYSNVQKERLDPADLGNAWGIISESATEHDRDPDDIEIVYSHWTYIMDDERTEQERCAELLDNWFDGSFEEAKETYLIGTPDEIAETMATMTSELPRVDRVIFTPFTFDPVQQDRFVDEMIPRLTQQL